MRKSVCIALLALAAGVFSARAQEKTLPASVINVPVPESICPSAYSEPVKIEGKSYNFAPVFFIYPDTKVDAAGAAALVKELGIEEVEDMVVTAFYVMNPQGEEYGAADFETFKELFGSISGVGNLKVVGIDRGASFVNTVIAPQADFCIAGVLSIGGKSYKLPKGAKHAGVPAYIAGKGAKKAVQAYVSMAGAVPQGDTYVNPGEPLMKVAADEAEGKSLAQIFKDAWASVLGKSYRFNNIGHTYYNGSKFGEYGTYELEPYADWKALNITRKVVTISPNPIKPEDEYLWYEYWPNELMEGAKEHSVPVLVLLHGNRNDPRAQAETSGFLQVAGEDRFFIVELEWQGSSKYIGMYHDGIEEMINRLLRQYPQLDPTRIYAHGLSAGSMTATSLGITKSHVFAAVGGNNGGSYSEALWAQASQKQGTLTAYCPVAGGADYVVGVVTPETYKRAGIYRAWTLYQHMMDLPVATELDFGVDPVFGQKLSDRETIQINKGDGLTVETGKIYKGDIPVMKLISITNYGHGNCPAVARISWDYMKHFARNRQTGELIYNP